MSVVIRICEADATGGSEIRNMYHLRKYETPALDNLHSPRIRQCIKRRMLAATLEACNEWLWALNEADPDSEYDAHRLLTIHLKRLTEARRI